MIHSKKAFLPEIPAYQRFFGERNIDTIVLTPGAIQRHTPDIAWYFMGLNMTRMKNNPLIIHEYASSSVYPFARLKDLVKRELNIVPDFRLFLNEHVKKKLNFQDRIPFGFRDMGIPKELIIDPPLKRNKKWDFIFVGNITSDMKFDLILNSFASGKMRERNLLVISDDYASLEKKYSSNRNISFTGPLDQNEVFIHMAESRFAINFKPLQLPYLYQTSTKILEYSACSIPVVTVKTHWVEEFVAKTGARFFYLEEDLSNFDWNAINAFEYAFPHMGKYIWDDQINNSGVLQFIHSKLGG